MSKYGEKLSDTALRFVRDLPGPIERVWDFITDGEKRALWLAGGKTSSRVGGEAVFEFDHSKITIHHEEIPEKYKTPDGEPEFDMHFVGEVLAYDPPHYLKVTWPDSNDTNSTLSITLTEKGKRVEMVLLHERIPDNEFMKGVLAGWHAHLDIMEARVAGTPVPPFWSVHMRLEEEYTKKYGF